MEEKALRAECRHAWAFFSMAAHTLACIPHPMLNVEKFREAAHQMAATQPDVEILKQQTNEAIDAYLEPLT